MAGVEAPEDIFVRVARLLVYVGCAFVMLLHFKFVKSLNYSDAFFTSAFVLLIFSRRPPDPAPRTPAWYVGAFLFLLAGTVSSLQADHKAASLLIVANATYVFFILQYVLRQLLNTRERIRNALYAFLIGTSVSALVCIMQITFHIFTFVPNGTATIGGNYRGIGLAGQPDFAAVSFVLGIVVSLGMLVELGWRRHRLLYCALAVFVVALLLTGSVGGMATAVVASITLFIAQGVKLKTIVTVLVAFGLVYLLLFSVIDPHSKLNLLTRIHATTSAGGNANSGTLQLREDTIRLGWDKIVQSPVIGHGLDAQTLAPYYDKYLFVYYPPHDMLILYWFGGGIFMLVGALIMMGSSISRLVSGGRLRGQNRDPLRATVLAACVTTAFFSLQAPSFIDRWLWFPFILALCFRDPQRSVPQVRVASDIAIANGRPRRVTGRVGRGDGRAADPVPAGRGRHAAPTS